MRNTIASLLLLVACAPDVTPTKSAVGGVATSDLGHDGQGNLYAFDLTAFRKVTPEADTCNVTTIASVPVFDDKLQLSTNGMGTAVARGFAVASDGTMYSGDERACQVVKTMPDGTQSSFVTLATGHDCGATGDSNAKNIQLIDVAVDANDDLLVLFMYVQWEALNPYLNALDQRERVIRVKSNTNRTLIRDWLVAGAGIGVLGPQGPIATKIKPAYDERIWTTDGTQVYLFDSTHAPVSIAGSSASGDADGAGSAARFGWIMSLTVDPENNLYVGQEWPNKVRRVTPDGVVTTIAGSAQTGTIDGTTNELDYPWGLVWSSAGSLDKGYVYVGDGNNTLRKIDVGYASLSTSVASSQKPMDGVCGETCGGSTCSANAFCTTTNGTPTCACKDGFAGDGKTCRRPCAISNGGCSANATCAESVDKTTQTCTCNAGFVGDGLSCERTIPGAITSVASGMVTLRFTGAPNASYDVQATTDLKTWTSIAMATADGAGVFTIQDPITQPARFYRAALVVKCAPGQMRAGAACANVAFASAGLAHACAVGSTGTVRCWGTLGPIVTSLPEDIGIAGASAIASGDDHACAIVQGAVKCWGSNTHGQLGNGSTTASASAVTAIASGAVAIAAGGDSTCAIVGAGTLECWGRNDQLQIADASTNDHLSPFVVSGVTTATDLALGPTNGCVVLSSGALKCWGANDFGQLTGKVAAQSTPRVWGGFTAGTTGLAVGERTICAIHGAGHVWCAGANDVGQLGNALFGDASAAVTPTGLASGATQIAAGGEHFCAIVSNTGTRCWGRNDEGELGDGTRTTRRSPVTSKATGSIALGRRMSCALQNGSLSCFGKNDRGQLGDGTVIDHTSPALIVAR
jgi:alpha-tubulin suppressor-like RCC1 family protein